MGGRPRLDPHDPGVMTAVKLLVRTRDDIDRLAAIRGVSRSAVIREALADHLEEHQEVLAS